MRMRICKYAYMQETGWEKVRGTAKTDDARSRESRQWEGLRVQRGVAVSMVRTAQQSATTAGATSGYDSECERVDADADGRAGEMGYLSVSSRR